MALQFGAGQAAPYLLCPPLPVGMPRGVVVPEALTPLWREAPSVNTWGGAEGLQDRRAQVAWGWGAAGAAQGGGSEGTQPRQPPAVFL